MPPLRPRPPGVALRRAPRLAVALLALAATPGGGSPTPTGTSLAPAPLVVEAVDIGAVEARTGALLLSGQAGGEVDGALVWALAGRAEDGRARVPFAIEVDGAALLRDDAGRRLTLGIYAYVVDDDGRVVAHLAQGLLLDRDPFAAAIAGSGLKFVGRFDLAPGSFALRVMVRNHGTGAFFMSWSLLEVPLPGDPSPRLPPPLVPDRAASWVLARQAGVEPLLEVGPGRRILPAARPTLAENRPLELFLGDHGWGPAARVGVRVVNDLGRTVAEPASELEPAAAAGPEFRRVALSPVDLPPGPYTLIVTVDEAAGDGALRQALRIEVVPPQAERSWAAAAEPAARAAAEPAAGAARPRGRELREAYLRGLTALAAGDADGARLAVAELERAALSPFTPRGQRELAAAEQKVLAELAAIEPWSLAPVALLHRRLERSYSARSQGPLAAHARTLAVDAAERLGRLQPGNDFSAPLMVAVAVDLAQANAGAAARELLERTLRLEPDCEPALLALGFSLERAAEHQQAAATYGRLVELRPDHHEGRLRLALNLIRTGRRPEGEAGLRGLLGAGTPTWVATLAAQELVRLLIAEERLENAGEAARAALLRTPGDQRQWILLASILHSQGRRPEVLEALRALPAASRGVAPRARYSEWPDLGAAASQSRLGELARGAESRLAAALVEIGR